MFRDLCSCIVIGMLAFHFGQISLLAVNVSVGSSTGCFKANTVAGALCPGYAPTSSRAHHPIYPCHSHFCTMFRSHPSFAWSSSGWHDTSGSFSGDGPRHSRRRKPNKTAAERRQQQLRSDTRALTKLANGLLQVHSHRGNRLSKVGVALKQVLEAQGDIDTSSGHGQVNVNATSEFLGTSSSGHAPFSGDTDGAVFYPWAGESWAGVPTSAFARPPASDIHDNSLHPGAHTDRCAIVTCCTSTARKL